VYKRSLSHVLHHEVTVWIVGILTALAGHEASTALLERMEGRTAPFLYAYLAIFVALTLTFYALYENPLPQKLPDDVRMKVVVFGAIPWLVGAAAFIFLFAFAAQVHRAIDARVFEPRRFLISLALFAISVIVLFRLRNDVLVVHSRYLGQEGLSDGKSGARHLVVILSEAKEISGPPDMKWSTSLEGDLLSLKDLKKPGTPNWPWEMLLRAVLPHKDTLEAMTLLCSPQSIEQAPDFVALVKRYADFERLKIRVWAERDGVRSLVKATTEALQNASGFNFNEVDVLSSSIVDLLKYLRFKMRLKPREIMIDYTGGQKPVSFVAAAVTLRGEVRAQYVDTRTLEPKEYDLVTNPEPKSF
jgi:hypothetical protein